MLEIEKSDFREWSPNTTKELTRHPIRVWQKKNLGWLPPYSSREFIIVHIVKGSIDKVWKAWNDVEVRKTYDKGYQMTKIVETVDDSCDGKFLFDS